MSDFEKILNDEEIINKYLEVETRENNDGGGAYHNLAHVKNVSDTVETILTHLGYDSELVENAKIAAILHDTGANEGKDNHAYRSYEFAIDYLERKNFNLKYKDEVLEAIKIHSDGFDTDNMIALSIILADKLDVKSNRITKSGLEMIGNRQYSNIDDIEVKIEDNNFVVNFKTNAEFDQKEVEEYYFTTKIFKAIKSFCNKVNLVPTVLINDKEWEMFKSI